MMLTTLASWLLREFIFMLIVDTIQSAASALAAGAGQAAFGNPNLGISNNLGGLGTPTGLSGAPGIGGASLGNGAFESASLGGANSLDGMILGGNGLGGGSMKKVCCTYVLSKHRSPVHLI